MYNFLLAWIKQYLCILLFVKQSGWSAVSPSACLDLVFCVPNASICALIRKKQGNRLHVVCGNLPSLSHIQNEQKSFIVFTTEEGSIVHEQNRRAHIQLISWLGVRPASRIIDKNQTLFEFKLHIHWLRIA